MGLRILMVNKFYFPAGGTEAYMFALMRELERAGHDVIPFAVQDPRNLPTPYAAAFSPPVALTGRLGLREQVTAGAQALYSRRAGRAIDAIIRQVRPHIAHLHNIYHHLSPSILYVLQRHGVPVVHHLHDYKLICANYRLFTGGEICERCKGNRHYQAVLQRCCTGGLGPSLVGAAEMYLHGMLGSYRRLVDWTISPSRFLRSKLAEFGLDVSRVTHIPNFVNPSAFRPEYGPADGYVAYVGRVTREKGVHTLVEAMAGLPSLELRVVGSGEAAPVLMDACAQRGIRNIRWLGALPPDDAKAVLARAAFMVLPSEWYENCPVAVLEAFALGKPVVATRLGGLPELIDDGQDGLLVPPRDPAALREAIAGLAARPRRITEMGRHARDKVERVYAPGPHLQALTTIYTDVLAQVSAGRRGSAPNRARRRGQPQRFNTRPAD